MAAVGMTQACFARRSGCRVPQQEYRCPQCNHWGHSLFEKEKALSYE